jgi:hypothetical protein
MSGYPTLCTEAHQSTFCHASLGHHRSGLEALKIFCIASFDLANALWMSNRCIADLDAKVLTVPLESTASGLGPVVSDDPIWDPKSVGDGLDELDYGLLVNLDHMGCFGPLGEFVDGD